MSSGRHEAVDVSNVVLQAFRHCDFEHVRRLMKSAGCGTVALGSSVSPAWLHETRMFIDRCFLVRSLRRLTSSVLGVL